MWPIMQDYSLSFASYFHPRKNNMFNWKNAQKKKKSNILKQYAVLIFPIIVFHSCICLFSCHIIEKGKKSHLANPQVFQSCYQGGNLSRTTFLLKSAPGTPAVTNFQFVKNIVQLLKERRRKNKKCCSRIGERYFLNLLQQLVFVN